MSHYAVAVMHRPEDDIEDILAPYDENMKVVPYVRFTRQEAIDYAREHYVKEGENKTDEECWDIIAKKYDDKVDKDGNIYSTYNKDSKWDWYQVGGRWSGALKMKGTGEEVNSAEICEIDFTPDPEEYKRCLRFWDVVVDLQPQKPGEDIHSFYTAQYYKDYYIDRETYARLMTSFSTFAVITPEGVWHEKGEMGWFGCSSETPDEARDWDEHYMERFIESADPHTVITIVDCHI